MLTPDWYWLSASSLPSTGIAERFGRDAGVLRDHRAVGTDVLHAGAVARLELVDERDVHAAHEPDLLRPADERRQRADEERALLLAELERREVRRRRDRIALRVRLHGVVDARELRRSGTPSRAA